ncbi:nose resistant to fluoxetine protein 6-like [Mizuhopecten yessoensis]|uniref:nose resistant to fluoxetine protein 6-like n=1 Tax=Mizuhopecten yessoensis TaxID=6573 RepID=UPI000B45BB20|nr:nose resistant to fluoxetine protein 6-like [Mizuhopecten yessoensis]
MGADIMKKHRAALVIVVLFLCVLDVYGQSTTPPPAQKPQLNSQDYIKMIQQGIQLLNSSLSANALQQLSNFTSLLPVMNAQNLINILQSLNINVPNSSQIGGALKFIQGALSAGTSQQNNGTNFNPFAKSQKYLNLISPGCKAALGVLGSQVMQQKQWALQVIDSWGKPHSGLLLGNTRLLGSYDQCLAIEPGVYEVNYCAANVPVPSIYEGANVRFGMCLPKLCTDADVYVIADAMLALIPMSTPPISNFAGCKKDIEYDTRAIIAICVCCFFLALMIFATIFDVLFVCPELKRLAKPPVVEAEDVVSKTKNGLSHIPPMENGASPQDVEIELANVKGPIQTNGTHAGSMYKLHDEPVQTSIKVPSNYPGLCAKLVLSFSVWSNGRKLLSTEQAGGALGAINGIRFLSMTWVILGHTYIFVMYNSNFENMTSFYNQMLKRRSFMAIANALLSVDTFFALSGLLVSYVFMKEMKREKGRINWFMFYFHRFWRLTPPYMLVMMMDIALFRYVGDGPTWNPNGIENDFCKDTWWTNLAYVNNIVKDDKMCFAWSWYLANDMQFYVISPLLLVPLYFSKKIGGFVSMLFLLGVTIVSAVISVHFELPSSQFSLKPSPHAADYFPNYYIKPYCRMGPYIIGIIAGYILYRTGGKYKIKTPLNLFIWAFMTTLGCLVVYGTYEETNGNAMSVGVAALYNAVHKTLWGVCVCWVVFACVTGNGGYINTILSWSPFVPLGRLTYCAYLVHPLVMYAYYSSLRQGIYGTDFNIIYLFMGHLVISYMVAFVISLAFESPMMALERTILRKDRKKTK